MKYKKIIVLAIFLVSLLAISAVSAADNVTSDVVSVDETTDDVISVDEADEVVSVEDNKEILENERNIGTFTDLANKINSGGNEIVLDCDYRYDSTNDSDYQSGVTISRGLVIDGNGHTIDGNGEAKLLVVSGNGVTLKNIVFTNIFSSSTQTDGAVKWTGNNGFLTNCNFTNISVKYGTSALSMAYTTLTTSKYVEINNCNFVNNYVRTDGNTITLGKYVKMSECKFINNTATNAIIYANTYSNDPILKNCEFINNKATEGIIVRSRHMIELNNCYFVNNSATITTVSAAANGCIINHCSFVNNLAKNNVYINGDKGTFTNCSFVNNSGVSGGAIYLEGNEGILSNCSFINNSATSYGGSVYWKGLDGIINNCSFVNNSANTGGAIYWLSNYGTLFNCSFIQNSASSDNEGGAIRWNGNYGNISNCYFDNNSAYGGSAISLYGANSSLSNCLFINNLGYGAAGAVYCEANECILTNCSFVNNSASLFAGAIFLSKNNTIMEKCFFINNSANDGGAIIIQGDNNCLVNCKLEDNNASRFGGAIFLLNNECVLDNCSFSDNIAEYGGAIFIQGNNTNLTYNTFVNNFATTWGGAIDVMGNEITLKDGTFVNNTAQDFGGAVFWKGDNGLLNNCSFIDNFASLNASSVYWYGHNGNLINSTFIDNTDNNQVFWWNKENGNIIGCEFINNTNSVISNGANFIRKNVSLTYSNSSFDFRSPKVNSAYLINVLDEFPIKSQIIFNFIKDDDSKNFTIDLKNNSASICDELFDLEAGNWEVTAIFAGDGNYGPCNTTFSITINPILSSLILKVSNATMGHETMLISNVSTLINSTVDDGVVTFYDNGLEIGSDYVVDGVATLTYVPKTDGEHTITAIYNSNNYISSNNTAKLLVDSASVELLLENGTVGFNSKFIANVKGLYSIINEGSVIFYIDNAYMDKAPVVEGFASFNYTPLSANTFVLKAVYCDSEKFPNAESTTEYIVNKADSKIIFDDVNATIGHEIIIKASIISSNNLTINEGLISFSENGDEISAFIVKNGVASLSYTPRTAGEHKITAAYFADNYQSSDSSYNLIVNKASTELVFNDISTVEYQIASSSLVNIKSDTNVVQEGKVKFYINNSEIGYKSVENGVAAFDYVSPNAGTFDVVAVFEETENYLASNATSTFTVEKLSTAVSASTVTTVYNGGKYLTATLKDSLGNPLSDMTLTIVLNGKTYTPTTDANGKVKVSTNGLAPKTYYPTITFDGNTNYDQATKSVKVTVKKATPKLTAKAKTFKKSVKTKKYTVTLKTNKNKVMKKVWVSLKVNKKTYKVKTNNKGQATFKITNLKKKGKYTATVKYAGSKYYNAKTVKPKITIK